MKRAIWILVILWGGWITSASAVEHVGTSTANFLKIGVGARAVALGGAYTALSNDGSALYWNPGGLPQLKRPELYLANTRWLADSQLNFVGLVLPMGNLGTLGASIYTFSSGDIKETTIYQPNGTGRYYSTGDLMLGLSYARQITDRFSIGGTFKWIQERIAHESASTIAMDVGSVFRTNFFHEMRLSFVLSNFGGDMQFQGRDLDTYVMEGRPVAATLKTSQWSIPLIFRIGVATDVVRMGRNKVTAVAEVNDSRDFSPRQNVGLELNIRNIFFLRGGYKFHYSEDTFSAGAGARISLMDIGTLVLDYAYADMGRLQQVNRFSLAVEF